MIASWILYALAISALVTVAGLVAERALAARGKPTRFVWAIALALSFAWPLGSVITRLLPVPPRPVSVLPFTIVVQAPSVSVSEVTSIDRTAVIDRGLIAIWVTLSALLFFRLVRGAITLQRSRTAWRRGRVNGVRVQLSDNIGPAVVGLRSMDVVLPEWILTLDAPLREIVLKHEEEHRSARDPFLLFGAAIAVAAMPWNVALWIQARRLRLAVEMDCDARVLRAHPSPERYGMLILTIAQRRSTAPALFAPMLSEPTTNLERRILAMKATTRNVARTTIYGSAIVVMAVLAFASSLQSAGRPLASPVVRPAIAEAATHVAPVVTPAAKATLVEVPVDVSRLENPRRLPAAVTSAVAHPQQGNPAPRYPEMLLSARVEGMVVATYTSNAYGKIDSASIQISRSTHDLFSKAVVAALKQWSVQPNSRFETPFAFVAGRKTGVEAEVISRYMPAGAVVIQGVVRDSVAYADRGLTEVTVEEARAIEELRKARAAAVAAEAGEPTYFEFQVEKAASPAAGNPAPRYPDILRAANVEGEVLVQFALGTDGRPNMDTFKVLKSSHELFSNAVRMALPNMTFYPAQVGGRPVKQLVQMPFQFSLSKQP